MSCPPFYWQSATKSGYGKVVHRARVMISKIVLLGLRKLLGSPSLRLVGRGIRWRRSCMPMKSSVRLLNLNVRC